MSPSVFHRRVRQLFGTAALALGAAAAPAAALEWVNITPGAGIPPAPRAYTTAIYDEARNALVVFGGESASGNRNDVWMLEFSPVRWTNITPAAGPAPAARLTPNNVYDPAGDRMLMWSGLDSGFFNDVWAFDLAGHTWTQYMPPAPLPQPRYGSASVFDPQAGTLVMFAGFTTLGRFHDTRRFDPVTGAWTEVTPALTPVERCLHASSYDSRDHRMILYGGQMSGPLGDLWAFDLDTNLWTELTPAVSPPGRYFPSQVYDANNHRALVFGGHRGAAGKTNEVWAFDFDDAAWQLLAPSGAAPTARDGSAMIYIRSQDRAIVFGGKDTVHRNDVWALEGITAGTAVESPWTAGAGGAPALAVAPNPARAGCSLAFELAAPGPVRLDLYDAAGRHVRGMLDGPRGAGRHTVSWDGRDARGAQAAPGLYFARLRTAAGETRARIALVR